MKKELALRIVALNQSIWELEQSLDTAKENLRHFKERRDALLRELVDIVKGEE